MINKIVNGRTVSWIFLDFQCQLIGSLIQYNLHLKLFSNTEFEVYQLNEPDEALVTIFWSKAAIKSPKIIPRIS